MSFAEIHPIIIKCAAIFGTLGVPTIFTMTVWCIKACVKFSNDLKFISAAIKSQIRSDLMKDFETYQKRGWCSDIEQQEWLNRYVNYHSLYGQNGVLEDKKCKIISMPNAPKEE